MALHVPHNVVCPPSAIDGYVCSKERPPYILQLMTPSASTQHLLALCDNARILMFDKTKLHTPLQTICTPDDEPITHVSNVDGVQHGWIGSSSAGYVAVWDAREATTEPNTRLVGPSGAPYLCVATSGTYAAVGTELQNSDAYIDVWDLRQTAAPLQTYSEVHSDDVTSLIYHPDKTRHPNVLLSGGMDGLVCAIDTSIGAEEDAVISVGNTNASLARVGYASHPDAYKFAPRVPAVDVGMDEHDQALEASAQRTCLGPVYAISNMQTLSLWDADKFDCLAEDLEVRKPTSFRPPWVTDYVIDAAGIGPLQSLPTSPSVYMYMGDQEGGMALVTAAAQPSANGNGIVTEWTLHARLPSSQTASRAHADIVRSVEWDDAHQRLYTGGEDGCLMVWSLDYSETPSGPLAEAASSRPRHGRPKATEPDSSKRRYSPYK